MKPTTPKNYTFMPFLDTNSHLTTKPYNFDIKCQRNSESYDWHIFFWDQVKGGSEFFINSGKVFQQERVLWGWLAGSSHKHLLTIYSGITLGSLSISILYPESGSLSQPVLEGRPQQYFNCLHIYIHSTLLKSNLPLKGTGVRVPCQIQIQSQFTVSQFYLNPVSNSNLPPQGPFRVNSEWFSN